MEKVKVKSGTRVETLILAKRVKSGRWTHIAKPIPKGTKVEVTIKTEDYKDVEYTVKHPSFLGVYIMVDGTYFKQTQVKSKLKIGDEFWFASIYSHNVWKDKIIKTTSRYAYFGKHYSLKGIYRIDLCYFNAHSMDISMIQEDSFDGMGDRVSVSKNKIDVQKELIVLILTYSNS